ncbi:MAG: glycosyltransferase [Candidatus Aenigmarchaeota archaeon]|nr:glycosyltransferase [Candidatus Aenigmarchaeota archaeon]
MKISVIIPTLNEEKYIEYTLFHIKKQCPLEIIVSDACSKDGTVRIAKRYGARIIRSRKKNAAAGRNAGASIARGDILLFMDADSIPYPNLLETVSRDFSKDKKLMCWTCKIYAFSPKWKEHLLYEGFNSFLRSSAKIKKPKAAGIVIAVRKSAFSDIGGFDEGIDVLEDFDLCSRMKALGKFKFSTKTCVYTSTRRVSSWGVLSSLKKYIKMYLKTTLNRERVSKKHYRPIR